MYSNQEPHFKDQTDHEPYQRINRDLMPDPNQQVKIVTSQYRWLLREASLITQHASRAEALDRIGKIQPKDTRETVILLWFVLESIPNLLPYMRVMIEAAAARVYKYRYTPILLTFGDNEAVMLARLFNRI